MNANERGEHELTDGQWAKLAPLLPPERPATGRPNHDHRRVVEAILWRTRTGARWRALPAERYGKWQTVYSRWRRWTQAGVWDRVLARLQEQADTEGRVDWDLHHVDGSVVRAHACAAGVKGGATRRSAIVAVDSARSSICGLKVVASQ